MNALPFASAATLLTLAVLTWLLYPLLSTKHKNHQIATRRALNTAIYRDQLAELENDLALGHLTEADHTQARNELQRRLLQDTAQADTPSDTRQPASRSALLLALFLPTSAIALYLWLGTPVALQPPATQKSITPAQIENMVAGLAERLEKNPDDLKGWMMLARSYKVLRRYPEGARAYEKVIALGGKNANVLTDYVDLLAAQANGQFDEHALNLLEEALQLEPNNTMALALAGSAAYTRQDYPATTSYWEKLLKQLPADSDEALSLKAALEEVHAKQGNRQPKAK